MDRRPNTVRITSEILPTERGRNTRETSSGTTVTDVGADVFQRGVSDHIAGRGRGTPSSHFGWSLTPRYAVRDRSGSGATRRAAQSAARTTTCNLLDDQQLSCKLVARCTCMASRANA